MIPQSPEAVDDLTLAALAGVFDPLAIIPDADAQRLSALAAAATEQSLDGRWLWSLTPDARRTGLAQLPADPAARRALCDRLPLIKGDTLGAALRAALADRPDAHVCDLLTRTDAPHAARAKENGPDANTLAQALQLLSDAGVALAPWAADQATARRLRRSVMLDQRALAQHRLLPTQFRGRKRELSALERYVDDGTLPTGPRSVIRAPSALATGELGVVVVAGIGGTGKSALVEALRRRTARKANVMFLTLDLDQTSLRAGERVALTLELLRQLGLLLPDLDQPLSQIRADMRNILAVSSDDGAKVEAASSVVYSGLSQLGTTLQAAGRQGDTLVLVFDTFEQALVAGQARVRLIADWLLLLRDVVGVAALRIILSGREADTITAINGLGLTVQGHISLNDLGTMAGRAKLRDMFRRFAIPHADLVPQLISSYGSNPLAIEIIAAFCRNRPREDVAELAATPGDALRGELTVEMRQRVLYARILNRITDPELRALANPGLVLRRITPQMIAEVLAEPCGLPVPMPPAKAEALYQALAHHIWLVRPALSGDGLAHVPDLRRIMLPQILSLDPARAVALSAAAWCQAQSAGRPGADLWDALYYRALVDPTALRDTPPDALSNMASYLGADITDLPPKAQAQLREAAGQVLTPEQIAALSGDAQNRALRKRQARQRSEGMESTILAEAGADGPSALWQDGDFTANPDLARAAFADADFAPLAAAAPDLLALLLSPSPPPQDDPLDLSHPAWLSALATLGPASDPAAAKNLRRQVQRWLATPHRPPPDPALTQFAALVASMTGGAILPPQDSPAEKARRTFGLAIQTPLHWRYAAMTARHQPPGTGPSLTVQVTAGLPILHPAVLDHLLGGASPLPGIEGQTLGLFLRGAVGGIAEVTRATSILDRLTLTIAPENLPTEVAKALFPGRLPEFHAPLRLALTRTRPSPALAQAIASVCHTLPWWPHDLRPQLFAGKEVGPTLAGTLIDLLDRAGQLPALAKALASLRAADPRAAKVSRLITSFATAVWR